VATLLLLQPLLQRLHDLVPAAERLDLSLFLLAQQVLGHLAQPFLRQRASQDLLRRRPLDRQRAAEDLAEHPVEAV